ncbi:apolipoprotein N-acyltransferase [Sinomicrobium weinanense]|uniref:Apolipoprotein N-acyltransferase n=1 Tax=Sinomicrobium weinanense TaxID=2842200 RepID=A0A926JRR0_9FLAO|nr:apolipoprotein N-acyltransferase [Sinomicrobium weinanense]MBC9796290.1 apolipoprotein N-acyltransferase [Sinomicrobium weinanense]MBU3123229.1 apolipoprotein N-acyltransferase [Sinomicrobium weinanense]
MTKNNLLLALVSGLLLAAGWPVYGVPILLFIAFVPLLLAEKNIRASGKKRRGLRLFAHAYLAFAVWNSITTWWIWYSTGFGMFFAIAVNSLLMTLVFWIFHLVARKLPPKIHLVFLPALWMAFEKFHLNWDFSWPWLNLGNGFSEYPSWIQWYEYTGTFGGDLWIWIVNIGLFKTVEHFILTKDKKRLALGVGKNVLMIAIPVVISLFIYHNYTIPSPKAEVVVLQPNIDPYSEKYQMGNNNMTMARDLVDIARGAMDDDTDYVIAPETALPEGVNIDGFKRSRARAVLQQLPAEYPGLNVITGADFYRRYRQGEKPTPTANRINGGGWYDAYNAALQVDNTDSLQFYIKSKLVVGVENFPFKEILEPLLGNIMIDLGGTIASKGIQKERSVFTSENGKYKAAPIICYESVYGEFVTGYINKGANFLAIITNDGWWSDSQGHKQHLSYARLRAIETRRSVARSANTGISAFIDQRGKVLKTLPYGSKGALKGKISLNEKKTFYATYGDYIARLAIMVAVLILLYAIGRKKVKGIG